MRRLKDLLSTNLQNDAYSAVDNLSLSFLGTVAEVDVEGLLNANFTTSLFKPALSICVSYKLHND